MGNSLSILLSRYSLSCSFFLFLSPTKNRETRAEYKCVISAFCAFVFEKVSDFSPWYGITLLSPSAGLYYWTKAVKEITVEVITLAVTSRLASRSTLQLTSTLASRNTHTHAHAQHTLLHTHTHTQTLSLTHTHNTHKERDRARER